MSSPSTSKLRIAAVIAFVILVVGALSHARSQSRPGIFIMGVDGVDPVILDRMMSEGQMPNFQKLAREGTYQRLGTSNPPQSPVAWSNFVTGTDPGGHGIFDFVHRDPVTYHPISSSTPPADEPGAVLHLFGYVIPLAPPELKNNRGGTPWWDALVEHGVDVEVYRIPGNFPTPVSRAKVLDGMGTVDIRGGYGTYTLYTEEPVEKDNPKGDIELVTVHDLDLDGTPETVTAVLRGPPDQYHLEPGQQPTEADYLPKGLTIHLDEEADSAVIEIDGRQTLLQRGEWSDWIEVTFDALPLGLAPAHGTVRFYAKELRPKLQIYASPVNLSPAGPAMPISSPDDFVEEVFDGMGFFYTQGMPEEVDALKDGVFDDDDYVKQVALVQEDTRRMIDLALDRFEPGGTTFVYLSDIDLQCHMLWRHKDPKHPSAPHHPAYDPEISPRHAHDIENLYRDVDRELGKIRERLPEDTLLLVMSDHGFDSYRRKVHLNAWLREAGYLVMKSGKTTGQIVAGDVDWSKTRAYGLGFNGLYLNLKGREGEGIVDPRDAGDVMAEISRKLEEFRDPKDGERVVLRVFRTDEIYSPQRAAEGPDMVVGYNRGYGCSDESTLGEITEAVIQDNTSRWSGSHLMDPAVVPGILLLNRKLRTDGHDLTDVGATILSYYGIETPPGMTGTPIL